MLQLHIVPKTRVVKLASPAFYYKGESGAKNKGPKGKDGSYQVVWEIFTCEIVLNDIKNNLFMPVIILFSSYLIFFPFVNRMHSENFTVMFYPILIFSDSETSKNF